MLRAVSLPPQAVLLLFLPALLYWESLTTSLREIRSNLRIIVLMSTVLVIATATAVAAVAHALGLPWGPACTGTRLRFGWKRGIAMKIVAIDVFRARGAIQPGQRTVVVLTGSGLKAATTMRELFPA